MMNRALKTRNCALKTRNSVLLRGVLYQNDEFSKGCGSINWNAHRSNVRAATYALIVDQTSLDPNVVALGEYCGWQSKCHFLLKKHTFQWCFLHYLCIFNRKSWKHMAYVLQFAVLRRMRTVY